jgi:hypothetical protein
MGVYRWFREQGNRTDWYIHYNCSRAFAAGLCYDYTSNICLWVVFVSEIGVKYLIVPRNTTGKKDAQDYPSLWFTSGISEHYDDDRGINKIPYLVPALHPPPGMLVTTNLTSAKRRFIVSSGIRDAITGSKPVRNIHSTLMFPTSQLNALLQKYIDVNLHPWSESNFNISNRCDDLTAYLCGCVTYLAQISATALNSSSNGTAPEGDLNAIAQGFVQQPTGLYFPRAPTQSQLTAGGHGPFCEVIEDYRESSALDVLGSIGGLLALLQGLHIFLFGRPLFWGMFGELVLCL